MQEVQLSGKAAAKLRDWIAVAEACQQQEEDLRATEAGQPPAAANGAVTAVLPS